MSKIVRQGWESASLDRCCRLMSALSIALLLLTGGKATEAVTGGEDKIGPGVLEAIRTNGEANIVVALSEPPALSAASDMAALKSQIGYMQEDVLSGLNYEDFQTRHVYTAVPALAGKLISERGLTLLAEHPEVVRIDLDVGGSGGLVNSVPVIDADLRHLLGNTGGGVVVAVLDSGLDTDHDNLGDDLIAEACFLDDDGAIDGNGQCPNGSDRQVGAGAAEDDAGHGSHVTGIVTSNGTQGGVGVAPDASIVAIKVTAGPSFAGVFFFFSEVVAALDYIINNPQLGVEVINMSIGTGALFNGDCDNSTAFNMAGAAAINTLRANGVTAFASAGNNGSFTQMTSPACLSNVISVGASDNADNIAGFTNSNASTDIFAPGVNVVSSVLSNGTAPASGTSMASPHAAGCAALLIESGEAATPAQIEARLETSAVTITDPGNGLSFPRIDCAPSVNVPPVCDANGPYVAECGENTVLDGTGSFDPEGGALTFLWQGPIIGSSAVGEMPTVVFPTPTGLKQVFLTVDDGEDMDQCSALVTVQDTLAPEILCNNPPTIVPPDAPISFTATATDICAGPLSAEITEFDCFKFTKKGKRIDKTKSCEVVLASDTITIIDSGGVADNIVWTVTATDGSGNPSTVECSLVVVNPGKNK